VAWKAWLRSLNVRRWRWQRIFDQRFSKYTTSGSEPFPQRNVQKLIEPGDTFAVGPMTQCDFTDSRSIEALARATFVAVRVVRTILTSSSWCSMSDWYLNDWNFSWWIEPCKWIACLHGSAWQVVIGPCTFEVKA
jgi:hypothetical protein